MDELVRKGEGVLADKEGRWRMKKERKYSDEGENTNAIGKRD